MKKKIVFFDGDGTLWYPKKTKRAKKPWWIYADRRYKHHENHMVMTPTAFSTIKKLKRMGVIIIILSTNPHPPKIADAMMKHRIKHFKVEQLFDEVHATPEYPEAKGEHIVRILKERGIPKSKALMVGDHYKWDYRPAKERGIDALLVKSDYEPVKSKVKTIKQLDEIFEFVT